jgi:hypothetical protein
MIGRVDREMFGGYGRFTILFLSLSIRHLEQDNLSKVYGVYVEMRKSKKHHKAGAQNRNGQPTQALFVFLPLTLVNQVTK